MAEESGLLGGSMYGIAFFFFPMKLSLWRNAKILPTS